MLMHKINKRRIVRLKKHYLKHKITNESSFKENLDLLKKEMLFLFQKKHLAKDVKFLRKMAIHIKQLHFDAKHAIKSESKQQAQEVEHFLSTPMGAPFISGVTLTQAADSFSEQNPKESDLSTLLESFASYGQHYSTQLLRSLLIQANKLSTN